MEMRWNGLVARTGEIKSAYKILVGKPEGKRPLVKPRGTWKSSIRMHLNGKKWEGMDWIHMAQDRDQWRDVVNTVMNLRVP
jgi:hypothetical protein